MAFRFQNLLIRALPKTQGDSEGHPKLEVDMGPCMGGCSCTDRVLTGCDTGTLFDEEGLQGLLTKVGAAELEELHNALRRLESSFATRLEAAKQREARESNAATAAQANKPSPSTT